MIPEGIPSDPGRREWGTKSPERPNNPARHRLWGMPPSFPRIDIFDATGGEFLIEGFKDRKSTFWETLMPIADMNYDAVTRESVVEDSKESGVVAVMDAKQTSGPGHFVWIVSG